MEWHACTVTLRPHCRCCDCKCPSGGIAHVIGCHGVKVGVGVHGEEGQEEDDEVHGEVPPWQKCLPIKF